MDADPRLIVKRRNSLDEPEQEGLLVANAFGAPETLVDFVYRFCTDVPPHMRARLANGDSDASQE